MRMRQMMILQHGEVVSDGRYQFELRESFWRMQKANVRDSWMEVKLAEIGSSMDRER